MGASKNPNVSEGEFVKMCMTIFTVMTIAFLLCCSVIQTYFIWVVRSFTNTLIQIPPTNTTALAIPWRGTAYPVIQTQAYVPMNDSSPNIDTAIPIATQPCEQPAN